MNIYLALAEVALVIAAAVATVHLKRAGEREWAMYRLRQNRAQILASPQVQQLAKDLVRFQVVLRDAFTPSMREAAQALSRLGLALDALPRPTWRQRIAMRVRGWFA